MRHSAPALVAALLVLLPAPSPALAQSPTARAITALTGNDPTTASRILTSSSTSPAPTDPLALFFRAALNETGFDPQGDPRLTCGFYALVAAASTPLTAPARTRMQALRVEEPQFDGHCDVRAAGPAPDAASAPTASGSRDTRAGVAAFVAGDYQTAGDILKPIAERNRIRGIDAVAAFFTAAMYQSGIGLPLDPIRSCALYMRAGVIYSDVGTWFEQLNMLLAGGASRELAAAEQGWCNLLATIGFDHRFQPATFSLAPAHSVAFTLSADGVEAAVSYRGRERRQPVVTERVDGMVFLPLQYTELPARPPATGTRHFVEMLDWIPGTDAPWRLEWTLMEIIGESVETIERRSVFDSTNPNAPDAPLDLRSVVVVRTDEVGRAEWAVLTGPDARREFIPTREEVSEIREEVAARDKRKAAVPRAPLPFPRSPSFRYANDDGCADLFAFTWSANSAEVLTVRAEREALRLTTGTPQSFDLSAGGPDLEVEVKVSNRAGYDWGLCTDIRLRQQGDEDETWRAVSGLLTIEIGPQGTRVSQPSRYRASLRLTGAEFVGPTGLRVRAPVPITITTWIGSMW